MTKRERHPKVFTHFANSGTHFDPYWDEERANRKLHERGHENKIRWAMGERQRQHLVIREHPSPNSHAPVTLPTLKWVKP